MKKRLRRFIWWSLVPLSLLLVLSFSVTQPLLSSKTPYPKLDIDPFLLRSHVEALASTSVPRNAENPEGLEEASVYIENVLNEMEIEVSRQGFETPNGKSYHNLLWSMGPETGPRIVVGAHYDVCDNQPGADDNASGVAGLLELSRMVQKNQPQLPYRIDFVAYTLEEPPYFRTNYMGSAVHAQALKSASVDVKAMLCLEMIGYFDATKGSQSYPVGAMKLFYPNRGDFIAVVGKTGKGKLTRQVKRHLRNGSDIEVRSINAPTVVPGIDFSDHRNYWAADYPAVMITNTAFYRNANYHEVTDTPESLDYNRMAEVVKGVYWALVHFDK